MFDESCLFNRLKTGNEQKSGFEKGIFGTSSQAPLHNYPFPTDTLMKRRVKRHLHSYVNKTLYTNSI